MTMGESRQELLTWLNDLLALNYTKIEQVGTGAALCQIFDSIYGDVQLSKLKFNTNQEYEYVNNYKVLQKVFIDHQIDKVVPVERLVKCRFQDNLEFLQWVKKYWDTYYPGGNYDAVGRRKGTSAGASRPAAIRKNGSSSSMERLSSKRTAVAASPQASRGSTTTTTAQRPGPAPKFNDSAAHDLNKQITQLQVTVDGLEKERDFYFAKLRDIEILVQSWVDSENLEPKTEKLCKEIQEVLYSTEEGFEVPENQVETF